MTLYRTVSFSDVTSGYVYVLLGFFAHLYIIFSTTLYFSLETELQQRTGFSTETLINYFACLSIIFLLFSLALKWTWPIKFEEALIVICIWILLRNLLPKDCPCCNPPPPAIVLSGDEVALQLPPPPSLPLINDGERHTIEKEEEEPPDDECQAGPSNTIYSVLCVIVMIASFMMNARSWLVSVLFTGLAIVLMIFTTLIPISCNQFNQANVNTNLLKFTVYSVIWFNNRRKRLTEQVLATQYRKGMRILYSYDDHQQNHLLCGVQHHHHHHPYKQKKKKNKNKSKHRHLADQCDDIACFLCQDGCDSLIPRPLFDSLERLSCAIIQPSDMSSRAYQGRVDIEKARHFICQLRNVKKIHDIHTRFCEFFSWKNRSYDLEIQNIFDLTKTLWILNVCPIFLLFVFLEYILINYCIHSNIQELRCLIQRVKVMTHIRHAAEC